MNPAIYVAFYWGTAWYSRVIEWFTKGPSHAALVYWSSTFQCWIQLGSEANGWIEIPLRVPDIYRLYRPPEGVDLWKGVRANVDQLGSWYDYGGLVGMSVVMVMWRWFKLKVKNPLQSKKMWFCSEAVAKIYNDSGVPAPLELGTGETEPLRLEGEIVGKGFSLVPDPKTVLVPQAA